MAISHFKSQSGADFTGTVTVFNSAGATTTAAATDLIRPSDWNSAHNQLLTITGNTAGQSTASGTNLVFAGGNNVTLSINQGVNVATVSFSCPNTTQFLTTAMASNRGSDFVQATAAFAGTNASGTIASNGISISVGNYITTQSGQAFSADASSTFQTLSFQNSNGVSFSNNAGALRVTHDLQFTSNTSAITSNALNTSVSRVINVVAATNNTGGGTASLSSNVSFSAANGLTFYTSAGGAIVASHNGLTTARASNDAVGLNTALTAGPLALTVNSSGISLNAGSAAGTSSGFAGNSISGSITHNTAGINISLSHPAWLTTAMASNRGSDFVNATAAFAGTNASGTIASNGISVSVGNYITTARASTDAVGLNTAQTNVTWTVNSSGLSLNAAGYAGTGTTFNGANVSGSVTLNSNGLNLSLSAGAGGTVNQTGPNIGVSNIGNTLGTTGTVSAGNYVIAGIGAVTLSQSSSASNGTLSISVAPRETLSMYSPPWAYSGGASNSSLGNSTLYFMPFYVPDFISASRVQFFISLSGALSAGNSTGTCSNGIGYAIYTLGTGTNSDRLLSLTSYSAQLVSHSMSSNTAYRATHYIGLQDITSHSTSQYAQSSSNVTTYLATSINGMRAVNLPMNTILSPGRYWMGFSVQTVTGNAMTNNLSVYHTAANLQPAIVAWGVNSSASNASNWRPLQGHGSYSAQSAVWPATIPFTTDAIRHGVSQTMVHFNFLGYATSTNLM
jgi:hypothetical protein